MPEWTVSHSIDKHLVIYEGQKIIAIIPVDHRETKDVLQTRAFLVSACREMYTVLKRVSEGDLCIDKIVDIDIKKGDSICRSRRR